MIVTRTPGDPRDENGSDARAANPHATRRGGPRVRCPTRASGSLVHLEEIEIVQRAVIALHHLRISMYEVSEASARI